MYNSKVSSHIVIVLSLYIRSRLSMETAIILALVCVFCVGVLSVCFAIYHTHSVQIRLIQSGINSNKRNAIVIKGQIEELHRLCAFHMESSRDLTESFNDTNIDSDTALCK